MATNSIRDSSSRPFGSTRWSQVVGDGNLRVSVSSDALSELCMGYWFPVYAYLRHCSHAPEIAQDITRTFQKFMVQGSRDGLTPAAGERFRDFLLNRLIVFLAADWHQLAIGGDFPDGPDCAALEARNVSENQHARTPEEAYQRSFASEIIARACRRLRAEASANGHLDMYAAMFPYLAHEPDKIEFAELAIQLGRRPLALVVALKRLRQRFRELVGEELADTVDTLGGMIEEQKTLHDVLRKAH